MTHLISYAENINTLTRGEVHYRRRLQRQAEIIWSMIKTVEKPDRPEIVLDGEIIITVKK